MTRRRFISVMGASAAAAAVGRFALGSFAQRASASAPSAADPDRAERNILAAADTLVPSAPGDPGAVDVPAVADAALPLVGALPVPASGNGVVQLFKGILALEQEYVRQRGGTSELWDPMSVSLRLSDVLDREAVKLGAGAFWEMDRDGREAALRAMHAAPRDSEARVAFLILYTYLLMAFYSGWPGVVVKGQSRHGWDVTGHAGHFAPPFGAGAGTRAAEVALIARRREQLASRGVETDELDLLLDAVENDWDHYERAEPGWRV